MFPTQVLRLAPWLHGAFRVVPRGFYAVHPRKQCEEAGDQAGASAHPEGPSRVPLWNYRLKQIPGMVVGFETYHHNGSLPGLRRARLEF